MFFRHKITKFINVGIYSYVMENVLLQQFFYRPMSKFGVRELSRKTHLDTKTVMKYLKRLVKQKIVVKYVRKGSFPYYESNRLSPMYRFEKSHLLIRKIIRSNLITFLEQELKPKAIVLFGSVVKGTYHEKSDVDIFIHGKYSKIYLHKYEHKLGHKINLLFEPDLKQLSLGLLENIYNGEKLSGKLEVI